MSFLAIIVLAAASPEAGQAAARTQPAEDPVVCRNQNRTNSRFSKKVCKRKSETDAQEQASQREAGELINRPAINPDSGGG